MISRIIPFNKTPGKTQDHLKGIRYICTSTIIQQMLEATII